MSEYDNLRDEFNRGYVQVYTGDGKGKTTAAIGLIVRALGAGLGVYLGQFIKAGRYSEIESLEKLGGALVCQQFGKGCFLRQGPDEADIKMAREGLDDCMQAMLSGKYQLVVLDEANIACALGLLQVSDLLNLIEKKPAGVELVFTGRNAPKELTDRADLVTEMREIRHYYRQGVIARKGIES